MEPTKSSRGSSSAGPPAGRRLPPQLSRRVTEISTSWLGRVVLRTLGSFTRIEVFDRSMTVAAQLFTSVFPILILLATVASRDDTGRIGDTLGLPEESRAVLEDAVSAADDSAFGIIGTLLVLVSATGVSRALTRAFAAIWELPRPKSNLRSVWRWVSVVLAIALALLSVKALAHLADDVPPGAVWPVAVSFGCDVALTLFVPWVLLSGAVRPKMLLPGAVIAALVMLTVRPATAAWLPHALETSADKYGFIGVAFTYLAWLYVVALTLLATAVLGRVIATDQGRLGARIRGASLAIH